MAKLTKLTLCAAALATAIGVSAPAMAGGSYVNAGYGSGYYGGGYYSAGYSGHRGGHYRGHHRGHRRHHGGGGKGAAIALGVIGGAILLSEVARADERRRYEDARYARDRYQRRRYDDRYDDRYGDRDYLPERDYDSGRNDDLDDRLEGGASIERNDGGPEPITVSYRGAYDACKTHARKALGNRGFILAAPARPETAEDMGGAYRITATVTAQSSNGESWSRAMYCEASEDRVYLLELI